MEQSDQISQVIETAGRVKAGAGTARDVQFLTIVRDSLVSMGNTALVGTIDDALASQSAAAPATPGVTPVTDWTAQPETSGTSGPPTLLPGAGGFGGGRGNAAPYVDTAPPVAPFNTTAASGAPTSSTGSWDFGVSALEGPYGSREPGPGLDIPTPTLDFMQSSPTDVLKDILTGGLNNPAKDPASIYDAGSLPPTQKAPEPDPLSGYQTAPNTAPLGLHMPGDLPPSGLGAEAATTDWRKERRLMREGGLTKEEKRTKRALGGVDSLATLPPDSAFAGVTDPTTVSYQPDMMARMIAQKMTGGKDSAMVAGMILPQVEQAMALIQSGQLGGGDRESGLGPEITPIDQLQAVESYVTQMSGSAGTQVDPYAAYNEGLKRALHSSQDYLQEKATREDANAPVAARLASQIDTTQEAMLAGAGGMTPGSYKKLKSRLDAAANEWLDLAMRSEPGTYVTYPQFLKERGAKTWFR